MRISALVKPSLLGSFALILGAMMIFIPIHTYAQSQKLESETVEITTSRGNFSFEIEIADEPHERTIGLMNRSQLESRGGMLFVFNQPQIIQMWMKNTLISLDMIFIDASGRVVDVAERTVPHSLDVVASRHKASFVLELAGGMAAFIGLLPGDRLKHRLFVDEQD